MDYYRFLRPLLFMLPPERAHAAALCALRSGLLPAQRGVEDPRLRVTLWGLEFPNPIGLAAGFDKNAVAADALLAQGFGFVETGTVTPLPQAGNARPRMFRLAEDAAVINRLGFNNGGAEAYARNLARRGHAGIVGANIGKNRDSADAVADYALMARRVAPLADYITVNVSSPNTQGLRDLQHKEALRALLGAVLQARDEGAGGRRVPLLLKIAPDLDEGACEDIAQVALDADIDGLIVSNTTVSRPESLRGAHRAQGGGLSGAPLMAPSTAVLARMHTLTQGRLPLIGVGGVGSAEDAYAKIRAGASLVQLYTALVYQGFGLVPCVQRGLAALLARDGFSSVADAVGVDAIRVYRGAGTKAP
jgi:dihydroorotate dehydrogenase